METVLTQAQQWLLAQDEASQATPLLQGFALLVNGGLSGLETEQAAMGTAVTGFAQIVSGRRALDAGWKTYEANAQKVADGRSSWRQEPRNWKRPGGNWRTAGSSTTTV